MKPVRKKVDGRGQSKGEPRTPAKTQEPTWFVRWAIPGIIALIVVLAFFPVLQNGFVNWDDDVNLLENHSYRGLDWGRVSWMFTTFYGGHYQPLAWVTFGLDYLLWGMEPSGYHLTNLLLHCANALLCYFLALRLISMAFANAADLSSTQRRLAAGFAALVFAIHPLRVESVAWATERRDVLSGLLLFLTVLFYLRANILTQNGARRRWMLAAVAVYGLSLLAKAIGMTLPIVLLLLDIYPLGRLGGAPGTWFAPGSRKVWFEKVPFFILAAAATAIAPLAQGGVMWSMHEHSIAQRAAQAGFGLAFYLWKTLLPVGLAPLYELPNDFNPTEWPFLLSGWVVLTLGVGVFLVRRRWPAVVVSAVCYAAIVAPVLGIVQSGPQIAADRYSYLSCVSWAILAGAAPLSVARRQGGGAWFRPLVMGMGLATIVALGILTWKQSQVWHDSVTLWRHTLAIAERSFFKSSIAHSNLGVALGERGQWDEGIQHQREALRINPAYAEAHNNLGLALVQRGELAMATMHYREAARIRPDYADAYLNLGNALVSQGQPGPAIESYRKSVRLNPLNARAHYNLGTTLAKSGEFEEAVREFRMTLQIEPAHMMAHLNLGTALAMRGDLASAIDHFQQVLRIDPRNAVAHEALGRVFMMQGRQDDAMRHLQEAVRIMKMAPDRAKPG